MPELRRKFNRVASNHHELKIAFNQLKSRIQSGLKEADDVFKSLAIPLSKLVGLKTTEMAEEGRHNNFLVTSTQNQWGRTDSLEPEDSSSVWTHRYEVPIEDFTTRATIAGKDLVQKQKFQLTQLVHLLRQIEAQVNCSQNEVSQNINDHQVLMRKYFEKAIRYASMSYQSGQNTQFFLVTIQIIKITFSRVHNVLESIEADFDNLIHKLDTIICNPMIKYVNDMKADIVSGSFPRLLNIVEEMVETNKDLKLKLEEEKMKVKRAEEWNIKTLSRLQEAEGRERKMKLQLGLLLESERRSLNLEQEFLCFREDQTKDDKLLWELLKKKRKYQPPDSPFAQTGFLCTGTTNKQQKLANGRSSIHHKPVARSCVQGLNPQTPRLDYLIPLGSTPSTTTHKYLLCKRIPP